MAHRPLPVPTELSRPYWEAAREHRLLYARCDHCGRAQFPLEVACIHCRSTEVRWVEGAGQDVLVVLHLSIFTRFGYRIGFPGGGVWRELFNSDVYENWVNPQVAGNGGQILAEPQPLHGFGYSASLVLPANSLLVFAR